MSLGCDASGRPLLEEENANYGVDTPFNASCPYMPALNHDNNVVAFHGDRQLPTTQLEDEDQPERFEPGAELVYR